VSGGMAKCVVEHLEMIDVEQNQRKRLFVSQCSPMLFVQLPLQNQAIFQTGQRVGRRQFLESGIGGGETAVGVFEVSAIVVEQALGAAALRHVAKDPTGQSRLSVAHATADVPFDENDPTVARHES